MQKKGVKSKALSVKIATNLMLSVLVLSVGALCLSATEQDVTTDGEGERIYRSAENGKGVSLMFNVYWGNGRGLWDFGNTGKV